MSSNAWNDFEHEHAGEGLSQADMSEMYHADQDAPDASSEMFSTEGMEKPDEASSVDDNGLGESVADGADTSDQNEESSGNLWNDFQHEHAGEGLSQADMSEMYHADQDAPDASSEMFSTEGMEKPDEASSVDDNGLGESVADGADTSDQNEESSGNPWNDFQHEHAGEGLSQADMSEMYHAGENAGEANDESASATVTGSESVQASAGNPWNDFQHEHAGEGLSQADMSEMYHAEENAGEANDESASATVTGSESVQASAGNPWNDFQHEHAGEGLSQADMSEMYHAEENADEANDESASATVTGSESVQASAGNPWNDFQHEHAGEGLSQADMSEMYHAQQNTPVSNNQTSATNETNSSSESSSNDRNESTPITDTNLNANCASNGSATGNQWNDFQHENAGKGWSHVQMVEIYHARQNAAKSANETSATSEANNSFENLTNDNQERSAATAQNAWNDFQRKHVGEGKTSSELADMYHQEIDAQNSAHQSSTTAGGQYQNHPSHSKKQDKSSDNTSSTAVEDSQTQNQNKTVSSSAENRTFAVNSLQHRYNQKSRPSIQWNLFQHLHRGKYPSKQDMSMAYNQFKENEKSFKWGSDYQLNLALDGRLQDPNSPGGQEAMKTGLFDEDNCLRRHRDIPYRIFQSKMFDMNITDRSKISSMYVNQSGTPHLHAANLRQSQYRSHAAVHTARRDADHILELQVVAPLLQRERLDDENFHILRSLLNGEENIQSRGIKMNRHIKAAANRGIARSDILLITETFKQEQIQAEKAQRLADLCHEKNYSGAASVFRQVANKCNALHSIHDQIMKLNENESNSDAEKQRQIGLLCSIQQYESQYGPLKFHGNNLTKYRQAILTNHSTCDDNNNYFYAVELD